MENEFSLLFSPLKIGSITVRNRIFTSAHLTRFAVENYPVERYGHYYAERAKGGVGLIVAEEALVHPTTVFSRDVLIGYDEKVIPGYQRITSMVHEHGAKIISMMLHGGNLFAHPILPQWSSSNVPSPSAREVPHAMNEDEIQEVIQGYIKTARHLKAGGFDGIEITSMGGTLIGQFLSPFFNKRKDRYGGGLENRMRFLNEIIHGIREECGEDFTLGMRICGDELLPGGLNLDHMKEIARILDEQKILDFLDVGAATFHGIFLHSGSMVAPLGYMTYLAAGIKEVVDMPVFTIGRINDPYQAEHALQCHWADMIGMNRALISDPELPRKAMEGRVDDIRTCIACNQGCLEQSRRNRPLQCTQNATVGLEEEYGIEKIKPADVLKKVLVIGGGPAGLEVARVAASRGHDIFLYEKEPELGGQVNIFTRVEAREEFLDCIRYLTGQVKKLGVQIILNREMTTETILAENPDVVVLATGSQPKKAPFSLLRADLDMIPGANQDHVLTPWEVLDGRHEVGEKIVIIDEDGHHQAPSIAEYLKDMGKDVEVVTHMPTVAADLFIPSENQVLYPRLLKKGVKFTAHAAIREITENQVIFNLYSGEPYIIDQVDTVVLVMGREPNNQLAEGLEGRVNELYEIGDCYAPRKVNHAIYEGFMTGVKI
jgi:mycofactocin system FadH/OYE family oxidoreductase 2